ncbi:hypothetical protein QBC46DRAFT_151795 [Diplogelasinospora grovesii]|uniref:Secreted protein n=1 Tax=Diplogelasinospora grovesii TaxID=303347 RepID=A0AAN6N4Z9_9PEZI|nr:hypothetical protein QBC46DRAFT_151795 [Diplogelasinospora grovesii]
MSVTISPFLAPWFWHVSLVLQCTRWLAKQIGRKSATIYPPSVVSVLTAHPPPCCTASQSNRIPFCPASDQAGQSLPDTSPPDNRGVRATLALGACDGLPGLISWSVVPGA